MSSNLMPNPPSDLKICGAIEVRDRDDDDPPYLVVVHRDVGGPKMQGEHWLHNPKCWCNPLVVVPEESRCQKVRDSFEGLKRLN